MNHDADCIFARRHASRIRQPHCARVTATTRAYLRIAGYGAGR